MLACKEIYVLSFNQSTLQRFLEGSGNDVNEQVVQPPHPECCYPAHSSHRTASLVYSSILLSLFNLRFYIFQSKWMQQKGGTSSLQPNNQQKCEDRLEIDSYRIVPAIHSLFFPHFSCLMPVVPVPFSVLHKTTKDFGPCL